LISSLLFLGVHLPGWISLHLLNAPTVVSVFVFGAAMAILLKLSKSLWACIVAHSLNDFISFVLFHI
jgi:membrane protease YdiL (CAAX protease family)